MAKEQFYHRMLSIRSKLPIDKIRDGKILETRAEHRPCLSDLRESGSIEQDADVVMFVYRDYYYHHEEYTKNKMELLIAKNRNGSVGTVKLKWFPEFQRME